MDGRLSKYMEYVKLLQYGRLVNLCSASTKDR